MIFKFRNKSLHPESIVIQIIKGTIGKGQKPFEPIFLELRIQEKGFNEITTQLFMHSKIKNIYFNDSKRKKYKISKNDIEKIDEQLANPPDPDPHETIGDQMRKRCLNGH